MKQNNQHFLSKPERAELLARHRLEKNIKVAYRINMLILLDDGFSYKEIAQLLLIGEGTVRSCYSKYLEDGIDGALSLHHHGKSMKLKEIPLSELSDFIEKTPLLRP